MNVLITAASRRVSLIRLFREAVQPFGGRIIAVDYETYSPALFFSDQWYQVPLVKDPSYLLRIQDICNKENITLIIPTIDQELSIWAHAQNEFKKKHISVSISATNTIRTLTDKWLTYQALVHEDIPFPHSFLPDKNIIPDHFPLFIKPRKGRGSIGAFPVRNQKEYLFFTDYIKDPVVQTYLEGKEFTVDALFDHMGKLIRCIPRYRLVIRSGVSDRGKTFINTRLTELIERIGNTFSFRGAINIQGKIYNDSISFFEINPRFSGGIQLSAAAGTSFAKLLVNEEMGVPMTPSLLDYQAGMLMTSYEDSLFIDTDNKLINPPIK